MPLPFRVEITAPPRHWRRGGIGAATCRALHAAGAQITIADVDQPGAEALARELAGASVLDGHYRMKWPCGPSRAGYADMAGAVNAGIGLVGGVEQTEMSDFERLFRGTP